MLKYILLILGAVAIWAGIKYNNKTEYPTQSKWSTPLIATGGALIGLFLFLMSRPTVSGDTVGWKKTPGILSFK